jgi:hypothetical protein
VGVCYTGEDVGAGNQSTRLPEPGSPGPNGVGGGAGLLDGVGPSHPGVIHTPALNRTQMIGRRGLVKPPEI